MHTLFFLQQQQQQQQQQQRALTFDTPQTPAMISAVSAARLKSEEYTAAGLASLDRRPATLVTRFHHQVWPEI
jgi:hypothetical protein